MSKNNKNARKAGIARQITATRKSGGKGPAKTQKVNTKRNTWFARLVGKVKAAAPVVEAEATE